MTFLAQLKHKISFLNLPQLKHHLRHDSKVPEKIVRVFFETLECQQYHIRELSDRRIEVLNSSKLKSSDLRASLFLFEEDYGWNPFVLPKNKNGNFEIGFYRLKSSRFS